MIYVLFLNDMRVSKSEEVQPVAWATEEGVLEALIEREMVERYTDPNECRVSPDLGSVHGSNEFWGKTFRKGGAA